MTITLWDTILPPALQIATKRLAVSTPGSEKLHKHCLPSGFLLGLCKEVVKLWPLCPKGLAECCQAFWINTKTHPKESNDIWWYLEVHNLIDYQGWRCSFLFYWCSPFPPVDSDDSRCLGDWGPVIPCFFCQLYSSHRNHGSPPQHSLYQHHGNQRDSHPAEVREGSVLLFLKWQVFISCIKWLLLVSWCFCCLPCWCF